MYENKTFSNLQTSLKPPCHGSTYMWPRAKEDILAGKFSGRSHGVRIRRRTTNFTLQKAKAAFFSMLRTRTCEDPILDALPTLLRCMRAHSLLRLRARGLYFYKSTDAHTDRYYAFFPPSFFLRLAWLSLSRQWAAFA